MITSITKLNEFIYKCENKLALTTAEKQIYKYYNLHKWLIKNGFVINDKNYNFGKYLTKFTKIKSKKCVKAVKTGYFFQNRNEYVSYRSKSFFVLANYKMMKIYHEGEFIAEVNCDGMLRSFINFGHLKINGKNLTIKINYLAERLFKLNCLFDRFVSGGEVFLRIKNTTAISFCSERFYKYTKATNEIFNRAICNNPYYNNFPYVLKSQGVKPPALYNFNKCEIDALGELPSDIRVLCPERFNQKKHVEVCKDLTSVPYIKNEDKFFKCFYKNEISFFCFRKTCLLKLPLNGEKCLIKKVRCGLKFVFEFGNIYFLTSAKILHYGFIDGNFIVKLESKGNSTFCNLGITECSTPFFNIFSKSINLKKTCLLADELLCENPFKTLKLCKNNFFVNAREIIKNEKQVSEIELFNLLLLAKQCISERRNLQHVNKHLIALLPYVSQNCRLSLLNLSACVNNLSSIKSLVDYYLAGKKLNFAQNEITLLDAIELAKLVAINGEDSKALPIDNSLLKKVL